MEAVDRVHMTGLGQSAGKGGKVGSRGCGKVGGGDSEDRINYMKDAASKVDILYRDLVAEGRN
jgi:hypothetical protein